MTRAELENLIKVEFNLNNEEIFTKLFMFFDLLIEANKTMNLTTIVEMEDVYTKHFYDSLLLSKCVNLNTRMSLLDIGSGAGFPGIVLKICYPLLDITLLEPTTKRCNFLNSVIKELDLKGINVVNDRAEIYIQNNNRESFDIVTARAVAPLPILLELSAAYVKIGGYFLSMKSLNYEEELANSKNAERTLKLRLDETIKFELPNNKGTRIILKYSKINKTNPIYPRVYTRIKSKPL